MSKLTVQVSNNPVIRLEWVHARAAVARWQEELKLLREEARRIAVSFGMQQMSWQVIAAKDIVAEAAERSIRGFWANAQKHAALYAELADNARKYSGFYTVAPTV